VVPAGNEHGGGAVTPDELAGCACIACGRTPIEQWLECYVCRHTTEGEPGHPAELGMKVATIFMCPGCMSSHFPMARPPEEPKGAPS